MSDLKPCPFCGGEARLTYSMDNHHQPYVTCDTPRCPGRNTYQWHYHTEAEAIEAWNHRAERKNGKWIEISWSELDPNVCCTSFSIQSAKCSICGKYHTTPYLYSLDYFPFCPNCGAEMERKR